MDEKDREIQLLAQIVGRWKKYALEACDKACFNCEEYISRKDSECLSCRISLIREEALK